MPHLSQMDNRQRKAEIRERALERRALIQADARGLADRQVFERAHKLDAFQLATSVHIYRSVRDEVETWPFFEYAWGIGKTVYVPVSTSNGLRHVRVTRDTKWQTGAYGIPEPDTTEDESVDGEPVDGEPVGREPLGGEPLDELIPSDITLVVVPVVAFDKACNRIGYGKGYYDIFLAATNVMTMGLAYECQKTDAIPIESHDVALSCVATDQRWYIPLNVEQY